MKKIKSALVNNSALFLILILLIIIGVSVFLALSLRTDTVDDNLKNDSVIKTLFVMHDGDKVLFTDVFIYYPVSKRGALINILGNTGSIYRSLGRVDRIDTIFAEKGIEVYKSEIEKLVGQSIPFYITIELDKFSELTDMLGGIKVFIPAAVDVKSESDERYLIPSGVVTLDGDKVYTYLTYTDPNESEEDVIERGQNVMVSFLSALNLNNVYLANKKRFTHYEKRLCSNLQGKDLNKLILEISNVDAERLVPQKITGSRRVVDGKVLLFPFYDGQLIKDVVKQATSSLIALEETNVSRIYVLEIKNGTTVQGLARNTAALLQSAGYDVLNTANADSNDYEHTVIINHIGNAEIGKNLGDFIRCTNIVDEEIAPGSGYNDVNANVDFTIILGKDFDGRYVKINGGK